MTQKSWAELLRGRKSEHFDSTILKKKKKKDTGATTIPILTVFGSSFIFHQIRQLFEKLQQP